MADPTRDADPQETREWLEALDSALRREGVERAHFLLERLIDRARRSEVSSSTSGGSAMRPRMRASGSCPAARSSS